MAKRTYLLTSENEILAYPSRKEAEATADAAADDIHGFDSAETLEAVLASGPAARAVEIWNSIPGVEPVKGFKSKGQAAKRIFQRLQNLGDGANAEDETPQDEAPEPVAKPPKAKRERKPKVEKKPRKSAKKAKKAKTPKKEKRAKAPKVAKGESKKSQVIEMISKNGGATMAEIMKATGWQAHSCRGALSTLQSKGGHKIESFKTEEGERAYRIA